MQIRAVYSPLYRGQGRRSSGNKQLPRVHVESRSDLRDPVQGGTLVLGQDIVELRAGDACEVGESIDRHTLLVGTPTGRFGTMTDWAGKLVGAIARIAGLLHLAANVDSADPWHLAVSPETVESAVGIGRYLLPHAQAAYAEMGADPSTSRAKNLLAWISRTGWSSFSKRDLFSAVRGSRFRRVKDLSPALALLEEHGHIRVQTQPKRAPGQRGRSPSPTFDVNPHLFA